MENNPGFIHSPALLVENIATDLEAQGWSYVHSDIDPADRNMVRDFFHVMGQRLSVDPSKQPEISVIAPRENSQVLATTHDAMSFHTDNVYLRDPCKSVALFCAIQAEEGGENELVDARAVLRTMPEEQLAELRQDQWQWNNPVTQGLSQHLPITDARHESIRWWRMGIVARNLGAIAVADDLEDAIASTSHRVKLRMQPGDVLVTDNSRIVHNRSAFRGNRHVYRARFW